MVMLIRKHRGVAHTLERAFEREDLAIFFDLLFLRPCARLRVCGVLVVLGVSCGSEHGTSLVGVCAITGVPIYGVAGACWCFWTGRVDLTASFF